MTTTTIGAEITESVLRSLEQTPNPRLKQVMTSLIRHLHDFVREVELTEAEWMQAIQFLTRVGQMCDDRRQEFILLSDTLGVSMLVDAINNRLQTGATPTTVEGPFHIPNSPEFGTGENMAKDAPGIPCFVTGTVRDLDGAPVKGAALDVWQTDGEGIYEAQQEHHDVWMRGIFHTGADGTYCVRTVAPIGYTIPMDGTVGELMAKTEISHMRPAHIHFALNAPGHHPVVTHLFQKGDPWIETDVVYGVKEPLITDFVKKPAGSKAPNGETMSEPFYEVHYDFALQKVSKAQLKGAAS